MNPVKTLVDLHWWCDFWCHLLSQYIIWVWREDSLMAIASNGNHSKQFRLCFSNLFLSQSDWLRMAAISNDCDSLFSPWNRQTFFFEEIDRWWLSDAWEMMAHFLFFTFLPTFRLDYIKFSPKTVFGFQNVSDWIRLIKDKRGFNFSVISRRTRSTRTKANIDKVQAQNHGRWLENL